jgi:hypothetical protein
VRILVNLHFIKMVFAYHANGLLGLCYVISMEICMNAIGLIFEV